MKSLIKYSTVSLYVFISLTGCGQNNCSVSFTQFYPANSNEIVDKGGRITDKINYYIVSNYNDIGACDSMIVQFSKSQVDSSIKNYNSYQQVFYKESKRTNIENLKQKPRDLYRYSQENDMIYNFLWIKGRFSYREKIRNGQSTTPDTLIKVE